MAGTKTIVGIDPGLHATGVAVMELYPDQHCWRHVSTVRSKIAVSDGLVVRCRDIGYQALGRIQKVVKYPDEIYIEQPQIYQGHKNTKDADPNDLLRLSILVGALAMWVSTCCGNVKLIGPYEWKKQVPKDIHHKRIRATSPLLANWRPSKDAVDAAGIALWAAKIRLISPGYRRRA
jgi:hypothetical protein